MPCVDCKHWQLRLAQKMAKQSFAPCAHLEPYRFISADWTCGRHEALSPDLVKAREDWLSGRARKMCEEQVAGEKEG